MNMMIKYKLLLGFAIILLLSINTLFSQEKYLLVVDVQDVFYKNTEIEQDANEMVNNINKIIEKMMPEKVIYIKATGKVLSISLKGIKAIPMEHAPEIDSNLHIVNNNIFTKVEGDAFSLEEMKRFLIDNDAKEIIIVGLLAEKCIYSTAIGGIGKGYNVYIVPEAIVSKSKGRKEKVLKKMNKKGVKILPINEIINAS